MSQRGDHFLLPRIARATAVILVAVGLWLFPHGAIIETLAAWLMAPLICMLIARDQKARGFFFRLVEAILLLLLTLVLLGSLWANPSEPGAISFWLFALPLLIFSVLPVRLAVALLVIVAGGVAIELLHPSAGAYRHQFAGAFYLTVFLSLVLVFLREYKNRQLVPLRRTDELTQAASRDYLMADLHKEIQRSEREGTDMAIIMIGLDIHLSDATADDDIRAILPRIGRFLHSQLRDFDSYYRMADLQFVIILPGKNTADASATADRIRRGLRDLLKSHDLSLTASAGIAGLNIGDDAESLRQSAANALRRAQQRGGNRVQTYSAWSEASNGLSEGGAS